MRAAFAAALLFGTSIAAAYGAPPFKVYSPIVESGATEIEYRGFRDFDHREDVNRSQTHKLAIGHGYSNWWTELYVEFEKEGIEALKLESFEWENQFQLAPQGEYWMDTGILIEYEHPAHHGDPGKLVIAPLLEKEVGTNLVATLNLRFEHEIGSNAAPGNVFSYVARLKYTLNPLFDPALEFFGEPGRINHFPATSEQTHWVGPAFYGKKKLGDDHTLVYSAALLFGMTSAAPDKRAVLRLEYEF